MNTIKNTGRLILAAVLGSGLTLGAARWFPSASVTSSTPVTQSAPSKTVHFTANGRTAVPALDFTAPAEQATPAVVHIRSVFGQDTAADQRVPEEFRQFYRRRGPAEGTGSGVIINAEGYIVTNNHVIENATEMEVTLHDKRSYKARLIGRDPSTDLAVVKIEEKGLPFLPLANSDEVRVGEWVLAVGNPFNLTSTVTAGIVSAKARNIRILEGDFPIESFIQTDAVVNPGNSGGALVNLEGSLIGINSAIASPTGTYAGYAFAIPANIAQKVIDDLVRFGTVKRGFLGVTIRDLTGANARELGLTAVEGVYVEAVSEEGSARQAGIRAGDVIRQIDNRPVSTVAQLQELIGRHHPGDKVPVQVFRQGQAVNLNVTLKTLPTGRQAM